MTVQEVTEENVVTVQEEIELYDIQKVKESGNTLFKQKKTTEAVAKFTEGIDLVEKQVQVKDEQKILY